MLASEKHMAPYTLFFIGNAFFSSGWDPKFSENWPNPTPYICVRNDISDEYYHSVQVAESEWQYFLRFVSLDDQISA